MRRLMPDNLDFLKIDKKFVGFRIMDRIVPGSSDPFDNENATFPSCIKLQRLSFREARERYEFFQGCLDYKEVHDKLSKTYKSLTRGLHDTKDSDFLWNRCVDALMREVVLNSMNLIRRNYLEISDLAE
jgi:hypothetical protein